MCRIYAHHNIASTHPLAQPTRRKPLHVARCGDTRCPRCRCPLPYCPFTAFRCDKHRFSLPLAVLPAAPLPIVDFRRPAARFRHRREAEPGRVLPGAVVGPRSLILDTYGVKYIASVGLPSFAAALSAPNRRAIHTTGRQGEQIRAYARPAFAAQNYPKMPTAPLAPRSLFGVPVGPPRASLFCWLKPICCTLAFRFPPFRRAAQDHRRFSNGGQRGFSIIFEGRGNEGQRG